jgi:hypothetical protein
MDMGSFKRPCSQLFVEFKKKHFVRVCREATLSERVCREATEASQSARTSVRKVHRQQPGPAATIQLSAVTGSGWWNIPCPGISEENALEV